MRRVKEKPHLLVLIRNLKTTIKRKKLRRRKKTMIHLSFFHS